MNPGSTPSGALAFAQATPETSFPLAGAVLLLLLLVGAAVLVFWARTRKGAAWRAPWSNVLPGSGSGTTTPQHLSSVRLDAVHRLHVIVWNNRHFLIATGANVSPVVIASDDPGHFGHAAGAPVAVPASRG